MIVADKKVLKANLAKGALSIQYKLVYLYSTNLNSLATNAALIASLTMFSFIETTYNTGEIPDQFFGYFYYFVICIALSASFLAYTQASVEVIWGPIMALSGDRHEEVMEATRHMKTAQKEAFVWGSVSGITLLTGVWVWELAYSGYFVGIGVTCVIWGSVYMMYREGQKAYDIFDIRKQWREEQRVKYVSLGEDDDFDEEDEKEGISSKAVYSAANSFLSGSVSGLKAMELERKEKYRDKINALRERIRAIQGRGNIWTKSLHVQDRKRQSDCFHRAYVTIEGGLMYMYESEKAYDSHQDPCNMVPIDLNNYELETNHKIIALNTQYHISASSTIRNALVGSQEIAFKDALRADFDVQHATKKLKFSLIPKNSSELTAREALHFLAEDDASYKQWTGLFRVTLAAYREMDRVIEEEVRNTGTTAVQDAVNAANHI